MLVAIYLFAIILANLSVAAFGPASTPVNAFLFIGLTLSTRDRLHDQWGKSIKWRMPCLILAGGLISYAITPDAGRIALASFIAFVVSEALDLVVYHINRRKPYLIRSNTSNVFGAAADSILFPMIAFGGFPWLIILGQFLAKIVGGFLWSLVLNPYRRPVRTQEAAAHD